MFDCVFMYFFKEFINFLFNDFNYLHKGSFKVFVCLTNNDGRKLHPEEVNYTLKNAGKR